MMGGGMINSNAAANARNYGVISSSTAGDEAEGGVDHGIKECVPNAIISGANEAACGGISGARGANHAVGSVISDPAKGGGSGGGVISAANQLQIEGLMIRTASHAAAGGPWRTEPLLHAGRADHHVVSSNREQGDGDGDGDGGGSDEQGGSGRDESEGNDDGSGGDGEEDRRELLQDAQMSRKEGGDGEGEGEGEGEGDGEGDGDGGAKTEVQQQEMEGEQLAMAMAMAMATKKKRIVCTTTTTTTTTKTKKTKKKKKTEDDGDDGTEDDGDGDDDGDDAYHRQHPRQRHHHDHRRPHHHAHDRGDGADGGVRYRECMRNHAASMGGYALDGCGEFLAGHGHDGLLCTACGCHRNFHRRHHVDAKYGDHGSAARDHGGQPIAALLALPGPGAAAMIQGEAVGNRSNTIGISGSKKGIGNNNATNNSNLNRASNLFDMNVHPFIDALPPVPRQPIVYRQLAPPPPPPHHHPHLHHHHQIHHHHHQHQIHQQQQQLSYASPEQASAHHMAALKMQSAYKLQHRSGSSAFHMGMTGQARGQAGGRGQGLGQGQSQGQSQGLGQGLGQGQGQGQGQGHGPLLYGGGKRFRTKFTMEQRERMFAFSERVGWRLQKHDEAAVQQFCADAGVKRHVLKVWMHNNKNTFGKKKLLRLTEASTNPGEDDERAAIDVERE